eukprot:Seg5277.1 transcript_id=Seg5277.1/GoldUCD/mRNA.D3Y31 product="putative protein K02A2.6" protein_id=Seg5277.1/GoldUCD/D3Y31
MREEIHNSHLGIQACLRRARECVFWPAMNAEIKDYISECEICQSYSKNQQKETLLPVEIPERPWQIVSTDLCDWNGDKCQAGGEQRKSFTQHAKKILDSH